MGIRKSNKKTAPIFWFDPKIKKPEPKVRQIIAPTNNIEECEASGAKYVEAKFAKYVKYVCLKGK